MRKAKLLRIRESISTINDPFLKQLDRLEEITLKRFDRLKKIAALPSMDITKVAKYAEILSASQLPIANNKQGESQ